MSVFIGSLVVAVMFFPFELFADGLVRFLWLESFLQGQLTPMKYSAIGPLISSPLFFLDRMLAEPFFLVRFNLIVFGLFSLVSIRLMRKHVPYMLPFLLVLFWGSMYPGHLIHYYAEVLSSLGMALGIMLMETRKPLPASLLILISVGNVPATFVPFVLYILLKAWRMRDIRYLILPVMAVGLMLADSKFRMPRTTAGFTTYLVDDVGNRTVLPYSGLPGFSYPMPLGIISLLFSFGKGILFFAPGLLLLPAMFSRIRNTILRNTLVYWVVYLVGLLLIYSRWWSWYGGWFWGPRFLLFASVPASFALAYMLTDQSGRLWSRIAVLLVSVWSFWVGVNGIVFGQRGLDICTADNYALEHLCWHVPEFSVLFHPFVANVPMAPNAWLFITSAIGVWVILALPILRSIVRDLRKGYTGA